MSEVFGDVAQITPLRVWEGVIGRAVHGEKLTLVTIELEPGAVVPEHHHVSEQAGVLVSGSLTFRIGDEERELARGATWCIPADVPHEVWAGSEGALLVEAFAPPRAEDWKSLDRLPVSPSWPAD